jgi:tetratricopeptide (TPR) repeat protein
VKNLKSFVLGLVFAILIFLIIPHNLFALVSTKFNPIKSANEEALSVFLTAEKEFKMGQILQNKHDYENAIICYIKSLYLWHSDEAHLNLTCCFYEIKLFFTAEKMALSGLQATIREMDSVNYIRFLVLLGNIYYETENYEKSLVIYKHISSFSMDEATREFIDQKIGNIENNISYYSP